MLNCPEYRQLAPASGSTTSNGSSTSLAVSQMITRASIPTGGKRTNSRGPVGEMYCPPEELNTMLEEYYAFRGWDHNGHPTVATIKRLEMEDIAKSV